MKKPNVHEVKQRKKNTRVVIDLNTPRLTICPKIAHHRPTNLYELLLHNPINLCAARRYGFNWIVLKAHAGKQQSAGWRMDGRSVARSPFQLIQKDDAAAEWNIKYNWEWTVSSEYRRKWKRNTHCDTNSSHCSDARSPMSSVPIHLTVCVRNKYKKARLPHESHRI